MTYVTTLVASQQAPFFDDAPLRDLAASGVGITARQVLAHARAVDVFHESPVDKDTLDALRAAYPLDVITQDVATRAKKLFMADMDATMVAEETLDELAAHVGLKDRIAAITARAMNGELDFKDALRERVSLLRGLPESALAATAARMTFTAGGQTLLDTLKAHGVHCVLVSGGFTFFTGHVAQTLGFDAHHGNTLVLENGILIGTVADPILDKNFKKTCLEATAQTLGIPLSQTVAIGDGANDLPMLQTAGLGIGFKGKKLLRDALPNHIVHGGLDTLVYALGLAE